jgi:hypothetical protein
VIIGRERSPESLILTIRWVAMREQPLNPYALQEIGQWHLRPLAEQRDMRKPLSSHLGALWSGALGRVLAPARREQDRYRSRGSLRPCIHYTTFASHEELKRLMLNIINAAARKMNGARPTFSHGSLAVIKWTVCSYRETV